MRLYFKYLFIILHIAATLLLAQSDERLEIVPTDSTDMKQRTTEKGIVVELVGNVHLRQGAAEMFCKRVEWWKKIGEVIIEKDVEIYDEDKTLFADKVYYYTDTKVYKAFGNVVLKDSAREVKADQIFYFKNDDKVIADGDVVMFDFENNVNIYAHHSELENEREYAIATGDPVLVKRDSTGKQEVRISGVKMELFNGGDKAVVTDSVRIKQEDATATCGLAEYYRKKDEIILKQEPVAWQKGDRISGEVIHLFIEKDKLVKAIVNNKAIIVSRVDTTSQDDRLNKLSGQKITLLFENNELYKAIVEKKATSYYYVKEEDEEKGLNKIIGDKIIVTIEDREIVDIVIESHPQLSEGIFYPVGFEPKTEMQSKK